MPDHYTHLGAEVLVNHFGIIDPREWERVETAAVGQRLVELMQRSSSVAPDLEHLRAIHRHLVQDLYAWGGRLRDTEWLRDTDWLRGRDADAFSRCLAWA